MKPDRFGRTYFNILYIDGSEDGIFLTLPPLKSNDFPWHHILREQFDQAAARLEQLDGTAITPDSLTPQSSLENETNELSLSIESQEWDHSPERLVEDEAILWESEPLQPLSAKQISEPVFNFEPNSEENVPETSSPEETITSPLGIFRRQTAVRRRNFTPRPTCPTLVRNDQTTNLEALLLVHRPLLPELVATDKYQMLDRALASPDNSSDQ